MIRRGMLLTLALTDLAASVLARDLWTKEEAENEDRVSRRALDNAARRH